AAALLTWSNLKGFAAVLGAPAADAMRRGVMATTICAVVLALVALLRYSFGRRGTPAAAVLLVASVVGSIVAPLWVRAASDLSVPPVRRRDFFYEFSGLSSPHVRVILLDGASLGFIRQRVAIGQLPNLARLLDRGAVLDVATLKPAEAVPVWAAAVTGKYPPK